jgi:hypothetical protein
MTLMTLMNSIHCKFDIYYFLFFKTKDGFYLFIETKIWEILYR